MKKILTIAILIGAGFGLNQAAFAEDNNATKADYVSVSTSTMSGINDVIKDQLQAIRERNDRIAYELNTQAQQENFEDPQAFMRDLRRKKKSLYNHVDYKFLDTNKNGGKFHKVKLTDKYGKSSIAMFKMEQDDGGAWKTKDIIILMSDDGPV